MVIRKVCKDDVVQCLAIYNYYIENTCITFEEKPLTYKQFERRVVRIAERYPFFVAVEKDKVLGYAYLDAFNDRSAYRYTADLSIYVDKDFLHNGTGSRLLAETEDAAKRAGIETLIAIVTASNENSMRFHARHGFICRGTLENVGYKFGKWLSVSYYQKTIGTRKESDNDIYS